ncbi:MAG: GTP cyclohydrolase I FolE [Chloroflexota bacterium]|nr:GTP cyclohydrolase I FolE [Chloroflexota bacterium]
MQPLPTHLPILAPAGEVLVERLLEELGEDPDREGLEQTPRRVWRSLSYLTEGYNQEPADVIGDAIFAEQYDEMVMVRDIEFYSLCEHHLLPFFGHAHVAYVPDGRIVGLSKLPRLVDLFSHRLQVQERLTTQIAEALETALLPKGVGVIIEASHLCMMMRGVQKQRSLTTTSAMRGVFKTDPRTRSEFLDLCKGR